LPLAIPLIITIVVTLNAERIGAVALWIFAATPLHNIFGMALGYRLAAFAWL